MEQPERQIRHEGAEVNTDMLQSKIAQWEAELSRMSLSSHRWGETRRFAGKSAGLRIDRRNWLIDHIWEAKKKLGQNPVALVQ